MLPLITLDGLAFHAPDGRYLFDNLTLAFGRERTGLVGRNGCGKTSLIRLIAGEAEPMAGKIARRGRIAMLRQAMAPPTGATLADLLGVAEPLARLARIERGAALPGDLEAADWELAGRMEAALVDVGLAGFDPRRSADSLSGGEATRAALARLLIEQPDVILLDEPTNNLDRAARTLVGEILERWGGGAIVASHDRALLRRMDRIIELSSGAARLYGGGWDLYAERRAAEEAAAVGALDAARREAGRVAREVQAARERKARSDAAGRREQLKGGQPLMTMDARAQRAENTTSRQSRLAERLTGQAEDRLEAAKARMERVRTLAFDLPSCGLAASKLVLGFESVSFSYGGGAPLLSSVRFRLVGPERLAVGGPNGCGKTTLVRLANGELEPAAGRIVRGVRAVVLDQRAAILADDLSLMDNFRRLNPAATANAAHAALARFLFRNVEALRPAGELSGGERLRAALACVLMADQPPKLLILDEPTNHLDLDSIAAVESALAGYDGAVLVVSHDDDFLDAVGARRRLNLI